MENLKKKRSEVRADDRIPGKKLRSKKERSNGGVTAEDAELEEFLAILKRLQAGYKQFQEKGAINCVGRSVVTPPATDFELDDFNQSEDDGLKISAENDDVIGFDLNADPVTEQKEV